MMIGLPHSWNTPGISYLRENEVSRVLGCLHGHRKSFCFVLNLVVCRSVFLLECGSVHHLHTPAARGVLKRGARLLGTEVRVGGEPSCGCWGPNWESSKPVLLAPEWSLWLTRDRGQRGDPFSQDSHEVLSGM